MSWNQEQIDNTLRAIVDRSISDPAFRASALQDGNAAIAKVSGDAVPANFRVRFVDNAGYDLTVVLPDAQAAAPQQALSDEEVAGVAGGTIGIFTSNTCVLSAQCFPTAGNHTACNPGYTKKPGNAVFCP